MKKRVVWLVLLLLLVFAIYCHRFTDFDQDLGRHLKLGEIILATRSVPKTNLFSYTHPDFPTLDHHWGSQVIFAALNRAFGLVSLGWLNFVLGSLGLGVLFWWLSSRVASELVLLAFGLLLPVYTDRLGVRPEIFANPLMVLLVIFLLDKKWWGKGKWFLPLIFLFWTNTHISYLIGLPPAFLLLCFNLMGSKPVNLIGLQSKKKLIETILIGVLVLASLCLNPWGLSGLLKAVLILKDYGYQIVENKSLFFLWPYGFSLTRHIFYGTLVLLVNFALAKRKPGWGEGLLLAYLGLATWLMVRNEPFFVFIALVSLSLNLEAIFKRLPVHLKAKEKEMKLFLGILAWVFGLVWVGWGWSKRGLAWGFVPQASYEKGVDFFLAQQLPGPIFNNFDIGGYLDYRLYPTYPVFVDNRPEAYPVEFFTDVYLPTQMEVPVWRAQLEQWDFQSIIWSHRDLTDWSKIFLSRISQDPDWSVAYLDEVMLILTRNH